MVRGVLALGATLTSALTVAQPLGAFRWQLQPYCNVLTLGVTKSRDIYTPDGSDDPCGDGTRAPATGTAVLNPDGTIAGTVTGVAERR
jgi:hypothetical protein